ncbi:MAG: phosphosulfolactate synthase, partial [Alphaproteobacteria bacterium]|nr:phosphosulfolactate synthase [Alphaproteobacteria bacterium]
MPTTPAFPFISLDPRRSLKKPRAAGLTMVSDYQLGMIALQDLLDVGGDYMDIFKVATGTARLFERGHLIAKLELLGHHSVRSLLGGQFQEYVLHTMGMDAFPRHLEEASAVGFDLIEISDNVVDLGPGTRERLFDAVRAAGLTPVGEIGDKREHSAAQAIVAEVQEVLGLGAELALIEGAELMLD